MRGRAVGRTLTAVAALAATSFAAAACGAGKAGAPDDLTVYAAASLTQAFTEIGHEYEQQHPGSHVDFSFGGSNTLAQQLRSGADADVFASADENVMHDAVSAGLVDGDPTTFTSNVLTIVTPPGNPADVTSFADLARPGVTVVVCAPQVPCGHAATEAEDAADVHLTPVSEENSVTDVVGKIIAGQADTGLVYVTDAASAGDKVETIDFPESSQAVNNYPIAILNTAADDDKSQAARNFVDLVTGEAGRTILHDAGFR